MKTQAVRLMDKTVIFYISNTGSIPVPPTMNISLITSKVEILPNGCWQWQKSTNSAGYGQLTVKKRYWLSHRYALACVQSVQDTDVVRHLCHNIKCCNPEHLAIGTHKDNYHDSLAIHQKANESKRHVWIVNGVSYPTCREAVKQTTIPIQTILKYTVNGVFDIYAYRAVCKIACWVPKI